MFRDTHDMSVVAGEPAVHGQFTREIATCVQPILVTDVLIRAPDTFPGSKQSQATGLRARKRTLKDYGFRSSDARPLFTSNGTELCACVTIHLQSSLRKQPSHATTCRASYRLCSSR